MSAVIVSKTDIDGYRSSCFHRFVFDEFHRVHQLGRLGKSPRTLVAQFHHDQFTLICHSPIAAIGFSAIARRNPGHMRTMAGGVLTRHDPQALPAGRLRQRLVNLGRRISHAVVAQPRDACRAVVIAKIRVKIINPGIDDRDKNTPAGQNARRGYLLLQRPDAGSTDFLCHLRIQSFWLLHINYNGIVRHRRQQFLRNHTDDVTTTQFCKRCLRKGIPKPLYLSCYAQDYLPCTGTLRKSGRERF